MKSRRPVNSHVVHRSLFNTMKRVIIAILIGVALTLVALFVGRYLHLSGHGATALNIFFPYSALVSFRLRNMWWLVSLLLIGQFPLYAVIGSIVTAKRLRRVLIPLLIVVHGTAAVIALYLDHYGLKVHYI
jgi:hypothetical protein